MTRGEVCWAELFPRSGTGQARRRPVVAVSHDGFNQTPGRISVIVVPVSSPATRARRGPTAVSLPARAGGLSRESFALCHQVTTLDGAKLAKRGGALSDELLLDVDGGFKAAMDLA